MKTDLQNQWFKVAVTLTESGASKFRSDGIAVIGSKGLDGHQILKASKQAMQAAKPSDFTVQEMMVRGDDMGRVMSEITKILGLPWNHISSIEIKETI